MGWLSVMGYFFGILAACAFISDEIIPRVQKAVREARGNRLP